MPYVETSALIGYNVELLFRKIAKEMLVKELERRRRNRVHGERDLQVDIVEERVDKYVINLQTTEEQKTAIPKKRRRSCKCS